MKNIAVLVYDLTNEYNITVVDGITGFFKDKPEYRLFISSVNVPHACTNEYDYQYWSIVELLRSTKIDGIIVVANSFLNNITPEELSKALSVFGTIPIFSVSVELDLPNMKYTEVSCIDAYDRIIYHLKTKHNRKKIAFFSAARTNSPDSTARFEAYKAMLKKHELEFNPDFVLDGDFTPMTAHDVVKEKYKSRKEIEFDAIICVNDYTALGCMGALQEYGINIPEDICIIGFDDSNIAVDFTPTISTVTQNVRLTGWKTAEIAYDTLSGKETPYKTIIESSPIYRQSCGCIDPKLKLTDFYDKDENYNTTQDSITNIVINTENIFDEMVSIYHLLNLTDSVTTVNNFFVSIQTVLKRLCLRGMAVCLYSGRIEVDPKDEFKLPDKAKLIMYIDEATGKSENFWDSNGIEFNPKKSILPENIKLFETGDYYIVPLFLQNINYGYIIGKAEKRQYLFHSVFFKIITSSFIHSYEYSLSLREKESLRENNLELAIQNQTDELTKILNRRGFYAFGQQIIDLSIVSQKKGVVFFCDMDGLKTINDTYGHKTGDQAIQAEAEVLKKAFRISDIIGRLSGDEFGIVAPGFKMKKLIVLRERIEKLNEEISQKYDFPFKLSISIGYAEFSEEMNDLQKVLRIADDKLYKEKKMKHSQRI